MPENSDLITFLEMTKVSNLKAIKTSAGDTVKLNSEIDVEFDSSGNFSHFINKHEHYEKVNNISNLLDKLEAYFLNMFPKLGEEEFKKSEEVIEEGLILTKHIQSPFLDDELWRRLNSHFLDKYPHLESEEDKSILSVITHGLVLSEDERMKKKVRKK